ncbi:hypothetical protein T552_01455 [Pneumocystis carinii B80]|uniref:Uncharacterized protein n=1 Tax=Pneumocystis carinii (strain B80) TaxID=1408658 RepID=A0A0W4ZKB9_PNEC8|nr:hypothetical protein T552_01455 [Pneumocystis carinii B80]KTW28826.1 hypothetical protein T552_01455 [Pneumocystis carinii B80]
MLAVLWELTSFMMSTFSKKKDVYIPDSEGEEDSFYLGTMHYNNVYSHMLNSKNMYNEMKTDTVDAIIDTEIKNSSIVDDKDIILEGIKCKNDNKEGVSRKDIKYRNFERPLSPLFDENRLKNMNSYRNMYPIVNRDESDDEIQLFGNSGQNKIDMNKDTEKESIISLEEEICNKDDQINRLYQEEKPEIQLLSLAACINVESLDENEYQCTSNKNKSILSKEDEIESNLKHSLPKETKAKKLRRSKTAKDVSKGNKNIKTKRYPSFDSYEDNTIVVNDTSLHENSEFENQLFKTVPDENTLEINDSIQVEDSNCHSLGFEAEKLSPFKDNSAQAELIISEKSKYKVENLKKPEENIELNPKKSPKILRSYESNLLSKIEEVKKNDIENADIDVLNSGNKIEDCSKFNNEKPITSTEIPHITDSPTFSGNLPVLKESSRKNVTTRPCYRVGLSKKAKIESLHSYLKR